MKPCRKCGAEDRMPSGACRPCRHRRWHENKPGPKLSLRRTRLDFEPIYMAVNRLRDKYRNNNDETTNRIHWQIPHEYLAIYENGVRSGTISVLSADAFCCDVLEINPVSLYGWEFLTIGEEEAA